MGKKKGRDFGPPPAAPNVLEGLKNLYREQLKPMEEAYNFDCFYSPFLTDADIAAKPMVLLLGQYSVGKTTFIRYLLGRDFPGMRVGPEPTTDRFVAVMSGPDDRTIPGNALAVHRDMPFTSLTKFGTNFLNRMEGSQTNAPLLDHIFMVDTPGVLSGEKQRIGRAYDFVKVVEWFAERADMILLLFDAHKLDISDEFKDTIVALRGHEDKIRVVLNKADRVTAQQLMRVYGALMWSLGKVVGTPEVMRVYIGSFWDEECQNKEFEPLFYAEASDLLRDLRELPRNAATRKINEMVKRARLLRTHALILSHLKSQMPMFGKEKKQRQLIESLADQFNTIHKKYRLPTGDFPNLPKFKSALENQDINKFPKVKEGLYEQIENILSNFIPALLSQLAEEQSEERAAAQASGEASGEAIPLPKPVRGRVTNASNPFQSSVSQSGPQKEWEETVSKRVHDDEFNKLDENASGKLPGAVAYSYLLKTGLSQDQLRRIWDLADIDDDGALDDSEFAVCMTLVDRTKAGDPLPAELPTQLIPPSKR